MSFPSRRKYGCGAISHLQQHVGRTGRRRPAREASSPPRSRRAPSRRSAGRRHRLPRSRRSRPRRTGRLLRPRSARRRVSAAAPRGFRRPPPNRSPRSNPSPPPPPPVKRLNSSSAISGSIFMPPAPPGKPPGTRPGSRHRGSRLPRAGEAELVVVRLLLRVVEDLVGFLHFLVRGVGLLVARVAVRVILLRQLAVRLLNLLRGGGFRDAENFVGVAGHVRIVVVETVWVQVL